MTNNKKDNLDQLWSSSLLSSDNYLYLEQLYENEDEAIASIDDSWRKYFLELKENKKLNEAKHSAIRAQFTDLNTKAVASSNLDAVYAGKQAGVLAMITSYRARGHQKARIDPLELAEKTKNSDLQLATFNLSKEDFATTFDLDDYQGLGSKQSANLQEIYNSLNKVYCNTIGIEYMQIVDVPERTWIQNYFEQAQASDQFSNIDKKNILQLLTAAEGLEKYLHTKYVGQKRFSLEGGDSLIVLLDEMIKRAGDNHVEEAIIGMAHRGRLNVLINILGKNAKELFREFEGEQNISEAVSSGDVKYHQGFSTDIKTATGEMHLALAFNPSHLEIVSPVVEGSVRARQERRLDTKRNRVIPVLIHGDSAISGQGVVMETFNMSQCRHYKTGGSIHIVINNQVGFTTSNPEDIRSTLYCTDIAKMIQAPVLHVNADDPEAVFLCARLAHDYRMKFNKDVVIDLICYRKHGHNEADEPSATQPIMYNIIRKHPTTRQIYAEKLIQDKVIESDEEKQFIYDYREKLEQGQQIVNDIITDSKNPYSLNWKPYIGKNWFDNNYPALSQQQLQQLGADIASVPKEFKLQMQVKKVMQARAQMYETGKGLDWGAAENLAYAAILAEGYSIRISGQDCGRGTFAHRHAVLHDQKTGDSYTALKKFVTKNNKFLVIDSLLSEEAVLAFEYGYASTDPNILVIWEAQFGDFANGAQVVIDQFISSGEQKWGRLCGLVMLLPHGYEGMGPEHSSARLERYLQLCAEHNIQVCVPSTPAQIYHMLRRQVVRKYRRPLIAMTPKSLLRHKLAVSDLDELANNEFKTIIADDLPTQAINRVVLCSGKVYYDLLEKRTEQNITNIALVRVEQLYPFPKDNFAETLAPYANVQEVIWCQEEPKNQGAWYCTLHHFNTYFNQLGISIKFVGREASASPAAGYASLHRQQQSKLVAEALNIKV